MPINIIGSFDLKKDAPIDVRLQVADQAERLAIKWLWDGLLVYQTDVNNYYRCDVATRSNPSSP